MKDPEQLVKQFEKYCTVLKKVAGSPAVERLSDALGERLLMCPRGLTEETGGDPGDLLKFSLEVAGFAKSLGSTFGKR